MLEPFNHPQSVPSFDGSGDLKSWSRRLIRDYRHANGNTDPSPSSMIQALDSAIVGDAAMFVGSNPLLSQIVEQADAFTATAEDSALFRCTLQDHYGVKSEVAAVHDGPIPHVVHSSPEGYTEKGQILRGGGEGVRLFDNMGQERVASNERCGISNDSIVQGLDHAARMRVFVSIGMAIVPYESPGPAFKISAAIKRRDGLGVVKRFQHDGGCREW
ncbi:hypothetical protein E4U14_002282 [Claviceps sp. LM454 group G7]|nr:hypothetical protein E4U14_002282 [Claviceps sp. LM454 group G7]